MDDIRIMGNNIIYISRAMTAFRGPFKELPRSLPTSGGYGALKINIHDLPVFFFHIKEDTLGDLVSYPAHLRLDLWRPLPIALFKKVSYRFLVRRIVPT